MKDGILIINKPQGLTSHDVVERIRNILHTRRVGHAGTLDPLATGVLVIFIGKATKLFNRFLEFEKEYIATLTLGKITDTGDAQGKVLEVLPVPSIYEDSISKIFKEFVGEIQQVPPMVSALRYKGKRLYQLHAQGIQVPRQPRKVIIKELRFLKLNCPEIEFYVKCSRGTYIRQLAYDIALRLGCGGYVSKIERISVGPFHIKDALTLEQVNESCIRHWQD
jgi:tRNA pseudouridine55 synthase